MRSLRQSPATIPGLAAMVVFVVWATDQAGFPVTHWAPGGLIVLALLAIALICVPVRPRSVPAPVLLALGCLAAFTAFSYLSILWATVPGVAWEGANRTLLYLLVFALFAYWPQNGRSGALLLGGWAVAMIGLAAFVALHLHAASVAELRTQLPEGRLVYPTDYANANAAQWLMAFWPAVLLARSAELPWLLRGVLAGGAVLLADIALLSLSRGALYSTPIVLLLVLALLPGRLRTLAVMVPVAVGIGATLPAVLQVGNDLSGGFATASALNQALAATFVSTVVVACAVAAAAAVEARRGAPRFTERTRSIAKGVAVAFAALLLVAALVDAGNLVARVRHGWDTFSSPSGYAANGSGSRLTSGLGSARYDFYRVALDEFLAHPVGGIGADNFYQQYLAHGRSTETPHYPHSVEFRTLSQAGLVGTLFALVGLAAALWAGMRALRGPDQLGRYVAGAALAGFAYWFVHGSFDWFWEFAGLGAPAFAMLGIASALAPRAAAPPTEEVAKANAAGGERHEPHVPGVDASARGGLRVVWIGASVLLAAVMAISIAAPWLSQLDVESAASVWTRSPRGAYARLNEAARLNPLSDEPYLVAGSIALRLGDLPGAEREFSLALDRSSGDAYATLELGAIASARGHSEDALLLLHRAVMLDPRDEIAHQALSTAEGGHRVDVTALNQQILEKARNLK